MSSRNRMDRRTLLQLAAAGVTFGSQSGWFDQFARAAVDNPKRKRSMILLWMPGGPSHIDTFDPKPGEETGGPFKSIETSVPGIKIVEHLPMVAKQMQHLAIVRSMSTKEGDHNRASHLLRTGRVPQEPLQYPTFGSLVSKELGDPKSELPNFISIGGGARGTSGSGHSAGFLGPDYAPLLVGGEPDAPPMRRFGNRDLAVADIKPNVESDRANERVKMMEGLNAEFAPGREGTAMASVESAYARALRLVNGSASTAFHLDDEPEKLRAAYGKNAFGQGCLIARRLVERGVPFVEISFGRWDTHAKNFETVQQNCETLDPAWATLMADLKDKGLLETTTIAWMGEFGRTPRINGNLGRDHYPTAWNVVLGGGGVKGGQVYGRTSKDGSAVEEKPTSVPDLLATMCKAIGIDPEKQNTSNIGRPIRIVEKIAKPLTEVLA